MAIRRDRTLSSQVVELGILEGRRSTDIGPVSNRSGRTSRRRSDAFWELDIAKQSIIPEPFRSHFTPPKTVLQWRDFLFAHLPILHWLWIYKAKWLIGDLIAGITIGITHIPQAIGFALLARLPVIFGLYSSFVPPLVYAILGSSRHISVGTFPVVSLIVGGVVERVASEQGCEDPTRGTTSSSTLFNGTVECTEIGAAAAITLCLLVGIIMIACGILQLGFITQFLSDSLVSGYTCAAAFTIAITQIRSIFGLPRDIPRGGYFANVKRLIWYFHDLVLEPSSSARNWAAFVIAVVCIVFLIATDYFNKFLRRKVKVFPLIIPAQVIVVIIATGISYGARVQAVNGTADEPRFGYAITGNIDRGLPPSTVNLIAPSLIANLIVDAVVIAIVSYVINISQASLFAKKSGYRINSNQEFLAYGAMNLCGSFTGSFATAGALSRTVLQHTMGGNTQLVSIISSIVVFITLVGLTGLFTFLPIASLGAIIVTALFGLYLQVFDLKNLFRTSTYDGLVWIVAFSTTFIVGLDIGLLVGVLFSLAFVVLYTILPAARSLGTTEDWEPEIWEFLEVKPVRGIYIYRFQSPLYFANGAVFKARLAAGCGIDPYRTKQDSPGCFSTLFKKCKKKKSTMYSRLSDISLTTTLVNTQAVEEKEGKGREEETNINAPAQPKKPSKKYFTMHHFDTSHQSEVGDYSANLEGVEEGGGSGKEGTLKSASKSSHLSRYLPLKGRSSKKEEEVEEEEEGGTDGTGSTTGQSEDFIPKRSSRYLTLTGISKHEDYLEAKEEFDRLPQQWKSNIRKHGHVHQYHTIVIDCTPMLFVDAAGVEVLLKTVTDYDGLDIQVLLANPSPNILRLLKRVGFFDTFGPKWLFPSVQSAVEFAKAGNKVRSEFVQGALDLRFLTWLERQMYTEQRVDVGDAVFNFARKRVRAMSGRPPKDRSATQNESSSPASAVLLSSL